MRRILATAFVMLILCGLAACGNETEEGQLHSGEGVADSTDISLQESLSMGERFEEPTILKSGKLFHTFTDVRIVTSMDGIPDAGCFLPETFQYLNEEKQWVTGDRPFFVQEDGSFSGVSVILIDVTTTSENAAQYTTEDLDHEGYPLGQYEDPYLFRVDTLGTLVALNHRENDELSYWPVAAMDYNSLYQHDPELTDNHYTYHLEPGETIVYTIGFVIYEDRFRALGCELDFSQLYFNLLHQVAPGRLIDLDLEAG